MTRRGYTLLELILVLLIMVIAGALSVPLIERMLSPGKRIAAADQVRALFAQIRSEAMTEGKAYRFSILPNSGKYRIEPNDPEPGAEDEANFEPAKGIEPEGELVEGVYFVLELGALIGVTDVTAGADWEVVAVILPDGSAMEDATIMIGLKGEEAITLRLRALTGAIVRDEPTAPSGEE